MTSCMSKKEVPLTQAYRVQKLAKPMKIDGDWNKPQWKKIAAMDIKNYMGAKPKFLPFVQAKMMYDAGNIFVIFRVTDRYVRSVTTKINGPVWDDSAVEFFFSPDAALPEKYFNLEINCGGTPLMYYNIVPRKDFKILDSNDIKMIEIAHSMPEIVDPEITEPVNWTVEYRLPIGLLRQYANISPPESGTTWRGNLYKCGDKTSNLHYITWSPIENSEPDFHLPQFFGILKFE